MDVEFAFNYLFVDEIFYLFPMQKQLTEEDLQEVFSQFGAVEHVSIRSLKFSDDVRASLCFSFVILNHFSFGF